MSDISTGSYDYIIVGAGMSGCIMANRLTASGRHRVLMLEAGGEGRSMWIPIPAGFTKLLTNPVFNWRFETEPEDFTMNRSIAAPRGKGVGGSSLINGMIYVRGQPEDYDAWEKSGAHGWGFKDVEPYFKKLEDYPLGDATRGHGGPMKIARVTERFPICDAFLEAAQQAGHPLNEDYNTGAQDGFGYYQVTQSRGRRWSVVDAYLNPARQRSNLRVETDAHVSRLIMEGRRCIGVTYIQGGREMTAKANKEVLMAAGAIQTPQILELSGIGNPSIIAAAGVNVLHALPNVGENYIDHYGTRMNWRVKNTMTLNETTRGWRLTLAVLNYFTRRKGILSLGTGLAHGFVKTRPELATPDVQYFFMHASYASAAVRKLDRSPGMTLAVMPLRPTSAGSVHIRSADALQPPIIRGNYLSTSVDQTCLVEGMKIARQIVSEPALQKYIDFEMSPGAKVQTDSDWLGFGRSHGQTFYHPLGTCRMGEDDAAVLDPTLKVKGLAGLRVVDASAMPLMVSGNSQAAVMMVAEKAADLVLKDAHP
jgi:choline dehydrogenase